jgi:hypothetical protein
MGGASSIAIRELVTDRRRALVVAGRHDGAAEHILGDPAATSC